MDPWKHGSVESAHGAIHAERRPDRSRGRALLSFLREDARLTGAKQACGEGACGACSVLVDGALLTSCTIPLERMAGRSIVTVEGIPAPEMDIYVRAFSEAGAVQCGFCTPGMVLAAKALLDRNRRPDAARGPRRAAAEPVPVHGLREDRAGGARSPHGCDGERPCSPAPAASRAGIGARGFRRSTQTLKARGRARYVDDIWEPGMLYGAVLRTPHPRARLLSLDVSAARGLPGVAVVATWQDIPGKRFIGSVVPDWPTLVAVGESRATSATRWRSWPPSRPRSHARPSASIKADYEVLPPVRSPAEALAPDAPALHPAGNVLSRMESKRGDAGGALASAAHVVRASFTTPFTDHAFMEPESALACPPDARRRRPRTHGRAERLRRPALHRGNARPSPGQGARGLRVRGRGVRGQGRPDRPAHRRPARRGFRDGR